MTRKQAALNLTAINAEKQNKNPGFKNPGVSFQTHHRFIPRKEAVTSAFLVDDGYTLGTHGLRPHQVLSASPLWNWRQPTQLRELSQGRPSSLKDFKSGPVCFMSESGDPWRQPSASLSYPQRETSRLKDLGVGCVTGRAELEPLSLRSLFGC